MNLHPIAIGRLHHLEFGQLIIRFFADFASTGVDPLTDNDFNMLFLLLQQQSPEFDNALMQIRANQETAVLKVLDRGRDLKMITIRNAVKVFRYSNVPAEVEAYRVLTIVFKTYKGIERVNYEAESLGLDNLVADLQSPEFFPYVQSLDLTQHLINLSTANTAFKDMFNQRSVSVLDTTVYDTKLLRRNLTNTYRDLAQYILVMAKRKNTPYYLKTLAALNNGRKYFADLMARRGNSEAIGK
ncbi:DUF6261 family protein [Flavobacterium sp. SUN046]|uniref:DUF6261 family protein n=1 Tax=Flavobacterium sp. SUN046 TaxID=3002440 RepID=UPI002DBDBA5B|nr:DUF6261 family protein [Flavobacterium sp. SUN046]MEC4050635.1 DUF6261 family protein [Flavobacterium sp. SUN046]